MKKIYFCIAAALAVTGSSMAYQEGGGYAPGNLSTAVGQGSEASGSYSTAYGAYAKALGGWTTAVGQRPGP